MPVAVSINNLRVAEHASEDPDVPIELAHEEQLPMFRSNWPKKSSGSKLGIGGTESTVTTEKQSRDTAGFAVTSGSCGSMIPFCADDLRKVPVAVSIHDLRVADARIQLQDEGRRGTQ